MKPIVHRLFLLSGWMVVLCLFAPKSGRCSINIWAGAYSDSSAGGHAAHKLNFYLKYDDTWQQEWVAQYNWKRIRGTIYRERRQLACALAYLGREEESIQMLHGLLRFKPQDQRLLRELAMMYEMRGDLDSAHVLALKAATLPAMGMYRTENVQIALLEAKMNRQDDPEWLLKHKIFDDLMRDVFAGQVSDQEAADKMVEAIGIHLQERIYLIGDDDELLAYAMFEYANIMARYGSTCQAYYLFDFVRHFDHQNRFPVQKERARARRWLNKRKNEFVGDEHCYDRYDFEQVASACGHPIGIGPWLR